MNELLPKDGYNNFHYLDYGDTVLSYEMNDLHVHIHVYIILTRPWYRTMCSVSPSIPESGWATRFDFGLIG